MRVLVALLSLFLAATGCSKAANDTEIEACLRFIPLNEAVVSSEIRYSNLELAARKIGIPRPDENASTDQVVGYAKALSLYLLDAPFISAMSPFFPPTAGEWRMNAGFDARDVHAFVSAGQLPKSYTAVDLEKPAAPVADRLLAIDDPPPKVQNHQGIKILSWPSQVRMDRRLNKVPVYDQMGRGGHFAMAGSTLLYAIWQGGLAQQIDASKEENGSIVSSPAILDLLKAAKQMDLYSYVLCLNAGRFQWDGRPLPGGQSAQSLLEPYNRLVVGNGKDSHGHFVGLIYDCKTSEQAGRNAARLKEIVNKSRLLYRNQAVSSLFDAAASGIQVSKNLLFAKLYLAKPNFSPFARRFYQTGEILLKYQ